MKTTVETMVDMFWSVLYFYCRYLFLPSIIYSPTSGSILFMCFKYFCFDSSKYCKSLFIWVVWILGDREIGDLFFIILVLSLNPLVLLNRREFSWLSIDLAFDWAEKVWPLFRPESNDFLLLFSTIAAIFYFVRLFFKNSFIYFCIYFFWEAIPNILVLCSMMIVSISILAVDSFSFFFAIIVN